MLYNNFMEGCENVKPDTHHLYHPVMSRARSPLSRARVAFIAVAVLAVSMFARSEPSSHTALNLWSADPLHRVGLSDAVGGGSDVHIYCARNEWEAIQVVVSARGSGLTNVTMTMSPLIGPNGATIDRVDMYREHYVEVTTSTPFSPLPPGFYPDALIPFLHPETGDPLAGVRFDAVPFDLADGLNQPLWIDVLVPSTAPAGDYTAILTVSSDLGSNDLAVTLTVWDFTLPDAPSLRSSFWFSDYQMDAFYDLNWQQNTAELYQITRRYYDALLDHRLMPTRPVDVNPAIDLTTGLPRYDAVYPGLGTAGENLEHYVDGLEMTVSNLPFRSWWPLADPLGADRDAARAYLAAVLEHFEAKGWSGAPYSYLFDLDEPNSAAAYQLVRDWGAFFDEVEAETGRQIPMLVTEHPAPDLPEWGTLVGAVDIWVPSRDTMWVSEDYYGQGLIAERLAAGDQVWWYTALSGASAEWWPAHGNPTVIAGDNAPIWQLDYPPLNYRIAPWFATHYGFTGLLYWQVAAWYGDPWLKLEYTGSSGYIYNGDGQLLFPGRADEIGYDGPVASMRLKWLQQGMEDFEYIHWLARVGESAFAEAQIATVARDFGDWEEDHTLWQTARRQLGERLDAIGPLFLDGFESSSVDEWSIVAEGRDADDKHSWHLR